MNALTRRTDLVAGAAAASAAQAELVAKVIVHDDLARIEPFWREFQESAVATPYQRFDWVRAFSETIGRAEGAQTLAVVAHDEAGAPMMLLPLAVRRARGLGAAAFVGGKHANYHMPLYAPAALPLLDRRAMTRTLRLAAAEIGGLDAYVFTNQPLHWRSAPNPLAAGGRPSPSAGYKIELASEAARRILTGAAHKNLRRKEKRLGAAGVVSYEKAQTAADVDTVIAAFLAHKKERFRETGIDNPFDDAATAFLRRACLAGLDAGTPAIELYSLSAGDRVVAVIGGVADARRFSDMIISFDGDAEISRSSPGHLLIVHVMRQMAERGHETFDLGVGEAHYKTIFCDAVERLVDLCVPVTARGAIYAAAASSGRAAKRFAKQTPWLWRMVRRGQSLMARG